MILLHLPSPRSYLHKRITHPTLSRLRNHVNINFRKRPGLHRRFCTCCMVDIGLPVRQARGRLTSSGVRTYRYVKRIDTSSTFRCHISESRWGAFSENMFSPSLRPYFKNFKLTRNYWYPSSMTPVVSGFGFHSDLFFVLLDSSAARCAGRRNNSRTASANRDFVCTGVDYLKEQVSSRSPQKMCSMISPGILCWTSKCTYIY